MQCQASQLVLKRDLRRKNIVLIVKDSRYDIHNYNKYCSRVILRNLRHLISHCILHTYVLF